LPFSYQTQREREREREREEEEEEVRLLEGFGFPSSRKVTLDPKLGSISWFRPYLIHV
jgi:hypothetical protein